MKHIKLLVPVLLSLSLWACKSDNDDPAPPTEPACKTCATYVKEWHDSLGAAFPIEYTQFDETFCNHEWDTLEGRSSTQIVPVGGGWWKYEMVIHCK